MRKKKNPVIEDYEIMEMAWAAYPNVESTDPRAHHIQYHKRLAFVKGAKALRKHLNKIATP